MKPAAAIAAAEARAHRAESVALEMQIRLAFSRVKIAELEASAAKNREASATRGVQQMVLAGAIGRTDTFTQYEWKAKFLADPGLIPLAVGKLFNLRKQANQ